MLAYVKFNIFESPAHALVNTVNTVGVMGKGIALQYKKLFPQMFKQYRRLCKANQLDIGQLHIYRTPNKTIVNFPTKKHWRQRSHIEYIELGLQKFVEVYAEKGIASVSFPQLGCGNGELNWADEVKPLMEHYLNDLSIPVYIHLYDSSKNFVAERKNPIYAREMRTARMQPSTEQVWSDVAAIARSVAGEKVEINEEMILIRETDQTEIILYREDVDDVWNTLRLRGTVVNSDLPNIIQEMNAADWLYQLMSSLDYVAKERILIFNTSSAVNGLRFIPLPEKNDSAVMEAVV